MHRLIHVLICSFLCSTLLFGQQAQEPTFGWNKDVTGSLNVTQVSFDNWAQGGEDAFSWQVLLDGKFENNQPKYKWTTVGKFTFGKTKLADSDFRKSVDEIKLETVLSYKTGSYVNPYVAGSAFTQLAGGFKYLEDGSTQQVSAFMDPGYFTQSAGLGIEPFTGFKTRAGASVKETITLEYNSPYADDPETAKVEKTLVEIGAESITDFKRKFGENFVVTSKLELFSNLDAFDEIDVNWDNNFNAKVAKYVSVNFTIRLLYDKTVSAKRQLNQTLAMGLTYSFM